MQLPLSKLTAKDFYELILECVSIQQYGHIKPNGLVRRVNKELGRHDLIEDYAKTYEDIRGELKRRADANNNV